MNKERSKAKETAGFLCEKIQQKPEIGFLTGTGLGDSVEAMQDVVRFNYRDIPHFPVSTVESHKGCLVFGTMEGKSVMAMQGRFHLYEGYSPLQVVFPIRVMQELGVTILIVSNAAGGLNLAFNPGDLMLIEDHINLTGTNPLIGPNENHWGIRFPDMTAVYDHHLASVARTVAHETGIGLRRGVYAGLKGPSLETPAETRFLRMIGADAVGFSTIAEVITGVHAGMKILGISTITNVNDPDHPAVSTVEDIIEVAGKASARLEQLVRKVVKAL
jgi:purine-nucleoside phosphorylase